MSDGVTVQLCGFRLAVFDVYSGVLSAVVVSAFLYVLFLTIFCESVASMRPRNAAECCQRVLRYRSSCIIHTSG